MLSVFLPIGWPDPARFLRLARIAVDEGAGALELGIPYSDPVADGPVLQAANQEALAGGLTVSKAIALLAEVHALTPLALNLLVYGNLVHARPSFCDDVAAAGAKSLLVPDIPVGEARDLRRRCFLAKLDHVNLVGPNTSEQRLRHISHYTSGYLYLAGVQGVTGGTADPALAAIGRTVKTGRPVYVGFGIRTRAQVVSVMEAGATSAIVGSALVEIGKDEVAFGSRVRELAGR